MKIHLISLLKKNDKCIWNDSVSVPFKGSKQSLMQSPILAIADQGRPFHVVCDASDFAIGCALMQYDADGAEPSSVTNLVSCKQINVTIQCMKRKALP